MTPISETSDAASTAIRSIALTFTPSSPSQSINQPFVDHDVVAVPEIRNPATQPCDTADEPAQRISDRKSQIDFSPGDALQEAMKRLGGQVL
jgi:hypothetical protein